jgi:hypothetical protein
MDGHYLALMHDEYYNVIENIREPVELSRVARRGGAAGHAYG